MRFDFKKVMSESTDEELVNIVTARRHDYQEEAIQAAEAELQLRSLSYETRENYRIAAEELYAKDLRKSNEPLETVLKVLTVIFPMIITFILSGFYKSNGYDRRARELVLWTIIGFVFYFFIVIAFSLFS